MRRETEDVLRIRSALTPQALTFALNVLKASLVIKQLDVIRIRALVRMALFAMGMQIVSCGEALLNINVG